MALNPVDHVTAVTSTRRADAVFVNIRKRRHMGHTVLDVDEDLATPVT